jgi:S1-C subfamily serine protease
VQTENVTPSLAHYLGLKVKRGAIVDRVTPGGPAAAAGLRGGTAEAQFQGVTVVRGGDVVTAIDGRAVANADDLVRIITNELRPGQETVFTVLRDGRTRSIVIHLGSRPADPQVP